MRIVLIIVSFFTFIISAGTLCPENNFTPERTAIQEIICVGIFLATFIADRIVVNFKQRKIIKNINKIYKESE
jgi:D-alanyl-lipoteichoic acid acyltransferase DltB (MBOAT superfamily)